MTLSRPEQLATIAACSIAVMVSLWLLQRRTRDAGIVDVGWAACLGLAAAFVAITGEGDTVRRALIGTMGALWGLRLASHLLFDRVLRGPEDGRYQMLRERFGPRINPILLAFFLGQGLLIIILSSPFILASSDLRPAPGLLDLLGLATWTLGLAGESLADRQLKAFKSLSQNHGAVCQIGLWRYSRHPNYFFEWLMWIGYTLVASGASYGWVAWTAPAVMLILILKVTGIPPTEARAIRSRGDAYRRYQQSTSAFIPWFPRTPNTGSTTP